MKTKSKKNLLSKLFFCVFVLLVFSFEIVRADGIYVAPYSSGWDYVAEESQQATIEYEDGIEKMYLEIDVDDDVQSAVWIFPVPALSENTNIDVTTVIPTYEGQDIEKMSNDKIKEVFAWYYLSQPWLFVAGFFGATLSGSVQSDMDVANEGVNVHQRLEKLGMVTELITAKEAEPLYDYLREKGFQSEENSIDVLSGYIGKDYSFVVSWSENQYYGNKRAVTVKFPTSKIYFPLFPTSVYGEKIIPVSIKIKGFTNPEIPSGLIEYSEVGYYANFKKSGVGPWGSWFADNEYTKIAINAPAKFFEDDLWISDKTPANIVLKKYFLLVPLFLCSLCVILLFSIISSVSAGLIVFENLRNFNGIKKFLLIGAMNCLTFIGSFVMLARTNVNEKTREDSLIMAEKKKMGLLPVSFLALFVFVVFSAMQFGFFSKISILGFFNPNPYERPALVIPVFSFVFGFVSFILVLVSTYFIVGLKNEYNVDLVAKRKKIIFGIAFCILNAVLLMPILLIQ